MKYTKKNRYLRKEKYTQKEVAEYKLRKNVYIPLVPITIGYYDKNVRHYMVSIFMYEVARHYMWGQAKIDDPSCFVLGALGYLGANRIAKKLISSWPYDCKETIFEHRYVWEKLGKKISSTTTLK